MTITINGTTGITNDGGYTGDGVVFADTTPANTLVTTTGGNVGIGTSSPGSRLSVQRTGVGSETAVLLSRTATSVNDEQSITWRANDLAVDYAAVTALMTGASSGVLAFKTISSGSTPTERARIDSSGNLLVGTTVAPTGASTSGLQLRNVSGAIGRIDWGKTTSGTQTGGSFYHSGTQVGTITYSDTATAYNTSSDYRLKENIQPMTGALAKVAALKPCTYNWKADGSEGEGFIAHELQAVVPDCVTGEKDAVDAEGKPIYQGIDTSFLVATLTAALQEQQAIILAQESALNALTARVAALDARLTSLEGK